MNLSQKRAIFDDLLARLRGLGFTTSKGDWPYDDIGSVMVRYKRKDIAQLNFSGYLDGMSILAHPVDDEIKILAGRSAMKDDAVIAREIDDLESLFRTFLVRKGELDFAQFPTDMTLKTFLVKAASIKAGKSPAANCVKQAKALVASYNRDAAVRLHCFCAEIDPGSDAGYDALRRAAIVGDHTFFRHAKAWVGGSHGAYLVDKTPLEMPERNEPKP